VATRSLHNARKVYKGYQQWQLNCAEKCFWRVDKVFFVLFWLLSQQSEDLVTIIAAHHQFLTVLKNQLLIAIGSRLDHFFCPGSGSSS